MFATVNALDLTPLVDVPVTGEDRTTSFQAQEQYTGTISWQTVNNDGTTTAFTGPTYATGTVYRAVVSLNAKTGFTFSGVAANSFTHSGATSVKNTANSGNVTITFPATTESHGMESEVFSSAVGDNMLTVTLTGGTFAVSLVIGQFTITTPGTGGFANLTGGTATRNSDTQVTITGLQAVTTAGSGQKITVAASAQATQAASVKVVSTTIPQWTAVNLEDTSIAEYSIVYGGGKFVTVGRNKAAYSMDGVNWTTVSGTAFNSGFESSGTHIAYGDDKFIAVGYDFFNELGFHPAAFSTDGMNWTAFTDSTLSSIQPIWDITYADDKFVAVGGAGIAYSMDGITWSLVNDTTFPSQFWIQGIAYGAGKFVAETGAADASGTLLAYSTDGITWTIAPITPFGGYTVYDIAYGNGKFVAVGAGHIAYWVTP